MTVMGEAQPDLELSPVPFGDYELLNRLAVGGMAEIFLARANDDDRNELLVVKRLLPHVSQHSDLVQLFLDEARVSATLEHPNVVRVFNVGAVGEQYFLSMEYLRGMPLTRMCQRLWKEKRTLPLNLALYVIRSVAKALDYAHSRRNASGEALGIVHRDVSPHNIYITTDGVVKLIDFGVARAANALHQTKTGALVGKVGYMSPEQCRSQEIDSRSDLFSLGVVLYELTVGRRLYSVKKLGDFEVLRRICEDAVPQPTEVVPDYEPAVEEIVSRALAKKPDERYQTAGELVAELEEAARHLDLDLSEESMAQFLSEEFSDVLEEEERRRALEEKLADGRRTPSGSELAAGSDPSGLRPPSAAVSSTGLPPVQAASGSLPNPRQSGSMSRSFGAGSPPGSEWDEERTERRTTGSTPKVRWTRAATPPPTKPIEREVSVVALRPRWGLWLGVGGASLALVVALILWLF